tara:strand:- start:48985 stop:50739 length:1755 start_codon:yes stop_codon:yes gene_type:complete
MGFLLVLFIFLLAAVTVVPLCKRLGLSSVIGYLVAGLAIGPHALGLIRNATEVLHFAELGVVLLLFIIGLELQPKRLWVMRHSVFVLGSLQLAVSTAVLTGLILAMGLSFTIALLIGFSLALSSTAFVLQLLGEQRQLNRPHGRAAFGVLLMQDLAVIPVIAILSLSGAGSDHGGGLDPVVLLAVLVGMVLARFGLRPFLRFVANTGIHELFLAASLAIVIGSALAMQYAGLSMGLGAFIAGMMVADSEYRHQLETDVMPFKGLLLGLFFMAVGMSADLHLLLESPLLIIGLAAGLVVTKMLVLWPIARLYGLDNANALRASVLLSQGGEFAFVLLTVALASSLVSADLVALVVMTVTLSMATTPFLSALLERWLQSDGGGRSFDEIDSDVNPVVIAGFGRIGQIVARVLGMKNIPFTALDASPGQVDFVRQFGNRIYYGDATRLDLLKTAKLGDAKVLVIAFPDADASVQMVNLVKSDFPDVFVVARARDRHHEMRLREVGVDFVIRETLLSALAMTQSVLEALGESPEEAASGVAMFQSHDRKTLAQQLAVFHDDVAYRQTAVAAAIELTELFQSDRKNEDQ